MLNGLDLFSGVGGISLAINEWVSTKTYVEIDGFCQSVLADRMQDGSICVAPIWDDIRTLQPEDLRFKTDIIFGGFPCQDISCAGTGAGLEGKRSGLFFEVARLVKECKPQFVFLENVPAIRTRGLDRVVQKLADLGYDCRWTTVSAKETGARHKRERWFLLAHDNSERLQKCEPQRSVKANQIATTATCPSVSKRSPSEWYRYKGNPVEPLLVRDVHVVPARMDRIKSLGNSVYPPAVKKAFKILMGIA
jgi:DNA (cytosine-5)-methyltransferase 1